MLTTPRVSVLLPVRNALPYLPEAVASLEAQTFARIEVLAIDDGSTDGSRAWLEARVRPGFRLLSTGGAGFAAALNLGLAEARGDLVARQDGDDLSHPGRFARQVAYLDAHADVALVATCADYIDAAGAPVTNAWTEQVRREHDPVRAPEALREHLPRTCVITHGSVMARRDVLVAAGGYDGRFAPAEDYDLWLRLLPSHALARLPERLYTYRLHGTQWSAALRDRQLECVIRTKLAYLCRTTDLPPSAAVHIAGAGAGAAMYRRVLDEFPMREAAGADWDVWIETDFAELPHLARALGQAHGSEGVCQVGNFFVRQRQEAP
ncbi:MAG: glycosyltransferase [Vicinamibacterales bacterium]|nr:glycosyltransferase [Vicinamibacterales bacterium]